MSTRNERKLVHCMSIAYAAVPPMHFIRGSGLQGLSADPLSKLSISRTDLLPRHLFVHVSYWITCRCTQETGCACSAHVIIFDT